MKHSTNVPDNGRLVIGFLLDDNLDVSDGVQTALITTAEYLRSLGHEVHYIVPKTDRKDLKNVHALGSSIALKFNGNSVRTPLPISNSKIYDLFKVVKFDVLHVQAPYSPLFAGRIINKSSKTVKIVGTFHILPYNFLSSFGTRLLGIFSFRSLHRIANMCAVSEPARIFMEKSYGIEGMVIPNPVDYEFYQPFKISEKSDEIINIVFLGRFDERKGVMQLLQSYNALQSKMRNSCRLIMCGSGPLHEKAVEFASKNSLDVDFPGFVSNSQKAEYLAKAHIAVFPSLGGESFGMVLVEAMSAGSGVVLGGNNPGYVSVLQKWPETLFDASSKVEFTAVLEKFISNKKLRNKIGVQQQADAEQYSVKNVASQVLEMYKEASPIKNKK